MKRILARLRAAVSMPALLALLAAFALLCLLQTDVGGDDRAMERQIEKLLSKIEGAGQVQVVIRTQSTAEQTTGAILGGQTAVREEPCGAIAVADGADDPFVRMQITQSLCALLGLQASQVNVLSAEGR